MISTQNVLDVFESATDSEREEGAAWYSAAHTFAIGLSERYGVSMAQAAAIIAVLSPRLAWDLNMRYADQYLQTGDCPTFFSTKAKLARVLNGDLDAVSGPKVQAFYRCIVDPSGDSVCIDRHAFDVANGEVGDDRSRKLLDRVGMYETVAQCYREAAIVLGLTAATVQAITWVAWRNAK